MVRAQGAPLGLQNPPVASQPLCRFLQRAMGNRRSCFTKPAAAKAGPGPDADVASEGQLVLVRALDVRSPNVGVGIVTSNIPLWVPR